MIVENGLIIIQLLLFSIIKVHYKLDVPHKLLNNCFDFEMMRIYSSCMKLLKIINKLLLFTYNTVQPPFMGYHAQAKTKINRKKEDL